MRNWKLPILPGILGMLILGLTVNAVRLILPRLQASAQDVKVDIVTPYTLTQIETVTDAKGVAHQGAIATRAVGSDGSTAIRMGTAENGSRIINFAEEP